LHTIQPRWHYVFTMVLVALRIDNKFQL